MLIPPLFKEKEAPLFLKNNRFSLFFNEYFTFPLNENHVLLTALHGGWVILSDKEYNIVKSEKINQNSELFHTLEEAGIVLTKRSIEKVTQDLKIKNSFLFTPTDYHVIAITNKCNFNCLYCHPEANPQKDEMSEETAKKVLNFIFSIPEIKNLRIIIEGGEPLLKWDLIKFIFKEAKEKAKQRKLKLRFSFTTNLSLMNDTIAMELVEMGVSPCISLDGPRELHNKQRPLISGEGSYKKTIGWINKLKNDYHIKIYAIPVITNISLEYGPEVIIDEYLKFGQDTIFLKPFRVSGRALSNLPKLAMKPEDFYNFWKRGVEYCLSLQKKGVKIRELTAAYFISNILAPYRQSMCHRIPCGAGISILSYNCDGRITSCDSARGVKSLELGHIDQDNYSTIRAKALSLTESLIMNLLPFCSSCPFVAYCGHCLADASGNFQCQWQKMALQYLFKQFLENNEDAQILRSWAKFPLND